ncbi:MAG: hypothetical protein GYA52_06745 [Chloroflexi bacterium]|nr:hypothetical protein [Chloroflexota bacterium]
MNKKRSLWIGIISLVLIALVAYFWADTLMDSLFAYRSPLAQDPPVAGQPVGSPLTRRVVLVLVDALREDTSQNPEVMPYLNELRQSAAWATMHSRTPSYSAPGWTTILTGAWPDINDSQPANPPDEENVRTFTQDDIFAAARRAGLQTAVSGFFWFEDMLANSGVDAGFYTPHEDNSADQAVLQAALPWLEDPAYQLVLVHLDQVDYAGHHQGGPQDSRWNAAAARVDAMLAEIVAALDLQQDTLLIFSDHGQIDQGGHGGHEAVTLVEPFVMLGAGVIPGHYADMDMTGIAPTVAALLGTSLPASNQGCALTDMLRLPAGQRAADLDQALLAQQNNLLRAYRSALGFENSSQPPITSAADTAAIMDALRAGRLQQERLPRLSMAVLLAIALVIFVARRWKRKNGWLLLGAALNLGVVNLLYGVIADKAYSLSALTSAGDLILSMALYCGIGFAVAWLVGMLLTGSFSRAKTEAARYTLTLTFLTLCLLAPPILWNFYRNGLLITWTLPEFAIMYFAFLCILQSLFVALFGLLFGGVAALLGLVMSKGNK